MILSNHGRYSPEEPHPGVLRYKFQEGAMKMNLGDKVSVTLEITGEVSRGFKFWEKKWHAHLRPRETEA